MIKKKDKYVFDNGDEFKEVEESIEGRKKPKKCKCGRSAMHLSGNHTYCCRCYVKNDGIPSDWHSECMQTFNDIKQSKEV